LGNWIWGLSLIALTVGIHASGVVFMALVLHNIWVRVERQGPHLDPKQREALFREFAEYQKSQRVIVAYHDTAADHRSGKPAPA
jgi:hypothetical protein